MSVLDWPGKIRDWWRRLWEDMYPPRRHQQQQQPQPSPQPSTPGPTEEDPGRYQVTDEAGDTVHQGHNLGSALQAWRELTDQQGSIVDTHTGEDLTPEPDDSGRFVVLDEEGEQVGTFNDFNAALDVWRSDTNETGSIIDTQEKKDVTPYKGHLTDEEVDVAIQLVTRLAGRGWSRSFSRDRFEEEIDLEEVRRLIPLLNQMRLPIFELANAVGDSINVPTSTVTVTKREAEITYKEVPYFENVPIRPAPTWMQPSATPQDERERRFIRSHDELSRVRPSELAMPTFGLRYARLELPVDEFQEEVQGDAPTLRVRKVRQEQTVTPREWEEEIEVSDESRVQNLALAVDLSGSMFWSGSPRNIEVAIALVVVLITKHRLDESRYSLRWFADCVGQVISADTTATKDELIKFVMRGESTDPIGGGTNIVDAVEATADDVRQMIQRGKGDEIPEVLLVTDGDDAAVTADSIFRAIGRDVVLHVIVINGSNPRLQRHSSTYHEIHPWQLGGGTRRSILDDRW